MIHIVLSEDISLTAHGAPVELPKSRKARALLAYLAVEGRRIHRLRLCEMFWDKAADPRGGLRWALTRLKKALGEDCDWLEADRNGVCLSVPENALTIDSAAGERLLVATESGEHDDYAAWLVDLRERAATQVHTPSSDVPVPLASDACPRQTIRYTHASDGTRVAYAAMGQGRPVLKAANWLSHLDAELEVPVWSGFVMHLARRYRIYRYDERGNGLSDWNVDDLSFDAFVSDLECVADTLELERFPLIGVSQGGAVSIEYARRHPGRVSGLILIGAYPTGWRANPDPAKVERGEAEMTLVRHGWGDDSPAYRQIFSHSFLPSASPEQLERFNSFQRQTTDARNAARFIDVFGNIDVRETMAEVDTPTLVLHSRGDRRVSPKMSAQIAAAMPRAELMTLPSNNHIPIDTEPAFAQMMDAIDSFIAQLPE
ncbi:alpha/beta hydrolase [Aurantiacibacter poecillastricola]|uniref:alpha/beta hydrolase n=1 Tax=Aurantiacibacter poecillastricola TaxID=3064385 RepID=UPI00273D56C3|nr:alpha/beta hydrolase [Aurantiacibacter sp. 219JJ12-13]MDP5260202.1 alpha/beta fold hydrolase [Aurantiacibacter sp. 219JJ12-13]